MMPIPLACYICQSEVIFEQGMAYQVAIVYFHSVLGYEFLDRMIWRLGLSLPASCIGGNIHYKQISN